MTQETAKAPNERNPDSQVIGVRFSKHVASEIKQEAARRNIRINQLILELWGKYQSEKAGN